MIYLHIGRHKTGTSALQQLLRRNRQALAEHGYTYVQPVRGGPGNHLLAQALTPAWMAAADAEQRALAEHELEIAARRLRHRAHQIVSSEAFQATPPDAAAGFFKPGATTVIVYLREQLDYLLSAYAQFIQAQPACIGFLDYARRLKADHAAFLDGWKEAFGASLVKPRVYDRTLLRDGDVRRDFLALIGADPDWLGVWHGLVNPTIGPELIEAKGLINRFVPAEVLGEIDLYGLLGALSERMPGRLGVGSAFAVRLRETYAAANARLFRDHLGGGDGFPMKDFPASPRVDPVAALETLLALLAETAPDAAAALRRHLPDEARLRSAPPLLPQDWDAAARTLQ